MSEISPLRPSPRLISCAGAFPARISVLPAREQGWQVRNPGCFLRWPGSFASYDPASSSWKTCQRSLVEGFQPYSQKWPRAGMMRAGECSELTIQWSAHRTGGNAGSVSRGWPTPTVAVATGGQTSRGGARKGELLLSGMVRQNWPTMTASEAKRGHGYQRAQAWPTPIATDTKEPTGSLSRIARTGDPLCPNDKRRTTEESRAWFTPTSRDYKDSGENVNWEKVAAKRKITGQIKGRLNPEWTEMLQGFPQGWTLTDGPPLRDHNTPTSHRAPDHDSPTTETD